MGFKKEDFKQRKKDILYKVIDCYLKIGEPIASEFLVSRYNLKISPATIRNEFQKLSREGYLYKCHISSGRIPTNKALKFFIDNLLTKEEVEDWKERWLEKLKEKIKEFRDFEETIEFLSEETRAFGFLYFPQNDTVIKKGLKYLFSDLEEKEFENQERLIIKLAELVEEFDNEIRKIESKNWPVVYIGRENPLLKIDNFSFLANRSRSQMMIFGILGNKVMPYEKNLGLLQAMAEIF